MNYIKEINAFYDRQEQVPLSSAAVALWYALMHINNKTRWKNTFTSPGSVLRNKAGLSESSFKRARAELEELGYIEVNSQGRGRAPFYTMHSLIVELEDSLVEEQAGEVLAEEEVGKVYNLEQPAVEYLGKNTNNHTIQPVDQVMTHVKDQLVNQHPNHDSDPLYKQYINKTNTKQNNTKTAAAEALPVGDLASEQKQEHVLKFYEENIGKASSFIVKELIEWGQRIMVNKSRVNFN